MAMLKTTKAIESIQMPEIIIEVNSEVMRKVIVVMASNTPESVYSNGVTPSYHGRLSHERITMMAIITG
eukprot:scaffold473377_cov24-Prasinocladus_malaysianus.AAC.1